MSRVEKGQPVAAGYDPNSQEYKLFLEDCYGRHQAELAVKTKEISDLKDELRKLQIQSSSSNSRSEEVEKAIEELPPLEIVFKML